MAEQLYQCSCCGKKFISDRPDGQIMRELHLNFPSTAVEDTEPVCSTCYVMILRDKKKVN